MLIDDSITAFFPYTSGGEKTAATVSPVIGCAALDDSSALETRYDNDILLCDGY
ncbi:7188_t:CDS:2 [Entrophospora sp. SA101]|nr:7188_t:CDS:2 [Entrophospora sp. SA101]